MNLTENRFRNLASPLVCLTAALVIGLTFVCAQRAYAACTVPQHLEFTLITGAGAGSESGVFALPVSNSPVLLSAVCTFPNTFNGATTITIMRDSTTPAWVWSGVDADGTVLHGSTNGDEVEIGDVCNTATGVALETETTGTVLTYENETATDGAKTIVTQLIY